MCDDSFHQAARLRRCRPLRTDVNQYGGISCLLTRPRASAPVAESRDDRHVECFEPCRIADDLDVRDPVDGDREPERSRKAPVRRHDDTDGAIHEGQMRQLCHVAVRNRPLRPERRATDVGRRARHIRTNDEIGIEHRQQALEVARAQRLDDASTMARC